MLFNLVVLVVTSTLRKEVMLPQLENAILSKLAFILFCRKGLNVIEKFTEV